jgi:hypothetical protein
MTDKISINTMPGWGFGNRVIYYNNLRQYSYKMGYDWSSCPWDGFQYFKGNLLNGSKVGNMTLDPCLGENFFKWNKVSTRSIFQLEQVPKVFDKTCAVHFRGTDYYSWNATAVLCPDYYIDSIDLVKDDVNHFKLFTDDYSLPSVRAVIDKLQQEDISFFLGENTADRRHFINDFAYMTECEYIISSPSTFCISAGFIGKNKRIIHSESWLLDRINYQDKFWIDLHNGGNKDYSIWRLV